MTHLRVGGNTADFNQYVPTVTDEQRILDFANAIGATTLTYALGMQNNYNPSARGQEANILLSYYNTKSYNVGAEFELDNEPDKSYTWSTYYNYSISYINSMSSLIGPFFTIVGPDPASSAGFVNNMWNLTSDPNFSPYLAYTTAHYYPGGNGYHSTSCNVTNLLSVSDTTYQNWLNSRSTALNGGLRISETNSCYNGGGAGVSNTYAAALWLLDYMHYMTNNGIMGVNIHWTSSINSGVTNPKYNPIYPSDASSSYVAMPVIHGMKAYTLYTPEYGRYFNLSLTGNTDPNIRVYAYHDQSNNLNIVMINRSQTVTNDVQINKSSFNTTVGHYNTYTHAQATWLVADQVDATQDPTQPSQKTFGFEQPDSTSGGPVLSTRATLNSGSITKASFPGTNQSSFTVSLPPYSALMLQLTP